MSSKIAIIDFMNQDVGLKILFPEATYFILQEEFDRTQLYSKYNFQPIVHNKDLNVFDSITSDNYDTIFIIAALYNSVKEYNNNKNEFFQLNINKHLNDTIDFINKNNFKNICFFDNFDYDYDTNIIFEPNFIKLHNIHFFKRYYNKEKQYNINVHPFPYIIFGNQCNIDMINDLFNKQTDTNKMPRIFFSGTAFNHIDNVYGVHINRQEFLNKIQKKINIYNPCHMPHELFINKLSTSKYCLDLLGVGDPNIRTFEILSCKSLRIAQRSNLKWNFDEEFCEETIFTDENDLLEKIKNLENDTELYKKCMDKQNEIVSKYMNINSLRNYIIKYIHI